MTACSQMLINSQWLISISNITCTRTGDGVLQRGDGGVHGVYQRGQGLVIRLDSGQVVHRPPSLPTQVSQLFQNHYFRLLLFQIIRSTTMIAHPTCSCCGCWVWAAAGWVESSSSGSIVITVCSIFQVILDTATAQAAHDRGLLCITD